ncbi:MAG: zinc transporter ZntB [Methylomarinum sp.]|nr:zinc transporter ZntB [Methylomarinum sp.]
MKIQKTLAKHAGLLYAKKILPAGEKIDLDLDDSEVDQSGPALVWLHMCALHPDTREFLENETNMDELVIDALLAAETRPRILVRKEGVMLIVRAMNLHKNDKPEDMISLRIWIDNHRVITTRRRDIMAIEDVKSAIEQGQGPKSTGEFLTMITNRVYARMEPYVEDLDDRVARVEEFLALSEAEESGEDNGLIRIRTAIFRRYINPQKNVLEGLIKGGFSWLSEENTEHLIESHDRVTRYIETLNDIRDRTQIINDEIDKLNNAKLNNTTYMFSVAATIFLPLSFLTGLMGINIGGMPGVEADMAFWMFSLFCIILVLFQVFIFKKFKWF